MKNNDTFSIIQKANIGSAGIESISASRHNLLGGDEDPFAGIISDLQPLLQDRFFVTLVTSHRVDCVSTISASLGVPKVIGWGLYYALLLPLAKGGDKAALAVKRSLTSKTLSLREKLIVSVIRRMPKKLVESLERIRISATKGRLQQPSIQPPDLQAWLHKEFNHLNTYIQSEFQSLQEFIVELSEEERRLSLSPLTQERSEYSSQLLPAYRHIDFQGRETELDQLRNFLCAEELILAWVILGNGGMGKTRLAIEAALALDSSWRTGFLTRQRQTINLRWKPSQATCLLVDYALDRVEEIQQLFAWLNQLKIDGCIFPVRVLLIDRGLTVQDSLKPMSFDNTALWYTLFSGTTARDNAFQLLWNQGKPLLLTDLDDNTIKDILTKSCPRLNQDQVQLALNTLLDMPGGRYPLFVCLMVIRMQDDTQDFPEMGISAKELIDCALDGVSRCPWQARTDSGFISSWLILLATVLGKCENNKLYQLAQLFGWANASNRDAFREASTRAQRLTGHSDLTVQEPLEPDLLGTYFSVRFWKKFLDESVYTQQIEATQTLFVDASQNAKKNFLMNQSTRPYLRRAIGDIVRQQIFTSGEDHLDQRILESQDFLILLDMFSVDKQQCADLIQEYRPREGQQETVDLIVAFYFEARASLLEDDVITLSMGLPRFLERIASIESFPSMSAMPQLWKDEALSITAKKGNLQAMCDLVGQGAQVNPVRLQLNNCAIFLASYFGHSDCVRFLLDRDAVVDQVNNDGATALIVQLVRMVISNV